MDPTRKPKRHSLVRTNKIVDRLTFNPKKHKQKFVKKLRQKLSLRVAPKKSSPSPITSLKFGSINVNGLDLEATWAVEQLLTIHKFDVRIPNL